MEQHKEFMILEVTNTKYMKCENIDIKKLEQFCKILVKLGITKNIYRTTTMKNIVSVREYQKFMRDFHDGKIKVEGRPEWKVATKEKVWNSEKQKFELPNNIVSLKDIAKYGMSEEDFYNQKVEISYKLCNQRNFKKIANLLSRFLEIDFEQAMKVCKEKDVFKNAVKYFANNVKKVNSNFFTTEKKCAWGKEVLALSFSNTNFKLELEI